MGLTFRKGGGLRCSALFLFTFILLCPAAHASDDRTVKSPDGKLEFRLFTALPEGSILNCLAYAVWRDGKPVLDTSYLGLDILFQEPLLGENVGLSADKPIHGPDYNGLWADYLQTSTTGRRLQFEVRVWNDGVAFRYIVPRSALLFDLAILDDTTQFRPAGGASETLPATATLPFIIPLQEGGYLGIYYEQMPGAPRTELRRFDAGTMTVHLPGGVPEQKAAFQAKTPWTGPWHILAFAASSEKLPQTGILRDLTGLSASPLQ
ncbi:MAG TPA: glycoside hydrolase family 97 N-terminal domain-containing protein [Bryobacteraceae bacterium]|nr:glycoside hydrolase family 97 N-terminal domain-containing protein [Bryobacteraceae bacterium]